MWAGSFSHRDKSLLPTTVRKVLFTRSKADDLAPRDLPLGNEIRLVWKLRIYWGDAYSPCATKDMLLKWLLGHNIGSDSSSRPLFRHHIKRNLHSSNTPKLSTLATSAQLSSIWSMPSTRPYFTLWQHFLKYSSKPSSGFFHTQKCLFRQFRNFLSFIAEILFLSMSHLNNFFCCNLQ